MVPFPGNPAFSRTTLSAPSGTARAPPSLIERQCSLLLTQSRRLCAGGGPTPPSSSAHTGSPRGPEPRDRRRCKFSSRGSRSRRSTPRRGNNRWCWARDERKRTAPAAARGGRLPREPRHTSHPDLNRSRRGYERAVQGGDQAARGEAGGGQRRGVRWG